MSVLYLLCLLVAVNLGESTPDGLDYTSKLTGEGRSLMLGHNQWLPCSDKMPATWKMEQTPILALLCRRKKLSPSNQLWSEDSPVPSRVSSAPDGAFLVEREKDLSTYNWNSFGLRYGKRQSGAVNSKIKFF